MTVLSVNQLSLRFGGVVAIQDVSLSVGAGELMAIVGPNGAGKTSLLNCITGAYRPSSGKIVFEGKDITGRRPHKSAHDGIARTFQHNELFPTLTTAENLMLGRHNALTYGIVAAGIYGGRARAWEARQREHAEQLIEFFELERHRNRLVGDLPYGIQKIIGLARATAMEPRLLLLDEPSAGLNRQEKEDLARFLLRLRHDHKLTLLWIEHDMQLVRDLADRVFVMQFGKALAEGAPEEVLNDPRVIEAYVGTAH